MSDRNSWMLRAHFMPAYGPGRIEKTAEIPCVVVDLHEHSYEPTQIYVSRTNVIQHREEPREFVRILCDLCWTVSNRVRYGSFNWPWSEKIWQAANGRYWAEGRQIKKVMSGERFGYCPKCFFQFAKLNRKAWECEYTKKFIERTEREIANVKNQNHRATATVSG